MTPEGITKKKIKAILKKYNAYSYMPVSNGLGAPALDFIVCYRGLFLSIEAKAWEGKKKMTSRQLHTSNEIVKADGTVFRVDDTVTLNQLENWFIVIQLVDVKGLGNTGNVLRIQAP